MVDKVIAGLPPAQADRPVAEWTLNELLTDGARLGLLRIRELVSRSMDQAAEGAKVRPAWEQRLIFDAASTVAKLLANVQIEAMRRKSDEAAMSAFLATVDAFERQLYGPTKKTAKGQHAKAAERPAKAEKISSQGQTSPRASREPSVL